MLKWFECEHLPTDLKEIAKLFYDLALQIVSRLPQGPEQTVALRKLLESKDAALRAARE